MSKKLVVAIDFDGTIVEHKFPDIGNEVPRAFYWMKKFQDLNILLLLWTMRSDGQSSGDVLSQAINYCKDRGIIFHGVNHNPTQSSWTDSPKAYAHAYIDDAAIGCPLVKNKFNGSSYVNWDRVGPKILKMHKEFVL